MKFCSESFNLLPSIRNKFNKYHSRYIFPLEFSTTCFSPTQIQLYIENSKESDEIGLFGFRVMECGFIRTEQKLVSYAKQFKNKWLSTLFPSTSEDNKKQVESKLKMISHQMNILRLKMTQNIYSDTLEEKFLKEHPVEDVIFGKLKNPSEELCVPIYVYLTNNIKFKLGFTNVERGEKDMEYWLLSDVQIKSA